MNMDEEYENVIKQLENLKYLLRIQGRHEEADRVAASLAIIKEAHTSNVSVQSRS